MKKLIKKVRSQLKWKVLDQQHDSSELSITSDPWDRTHTVHWPTGGADWRWIEYVHELAHAWLTERVHPLMATAIFVHGTPDEAMRELEWPKKSAADWYADALLMQWCPAEEAAEIQEHLQILLAPPPALQQSWLFYAAALLAAQGIHWNIAGPQIPAMVRPAVDTFLRFPPEKPSVKAIQALTNQLAALTTDYRVEVAHEDGQDLWRVYTER